MCGALGRGGAAAGARDRRPLPAQYVRALRAVASVTDKPIAAVASPHHLADHIGVLDWPRGRFEFEGSAVELYGFEWAAHCDDRSAWLLTDERMIHSSDLIDPDQPPFWRFAGDERFRRHERNLREVYDLGWDHLSASHGNVGLRPKSADMHGFDAAAVPNAEMVAWAVSEPR